MDTKALQVNLRRFAAELVQFADQAAIVLDASPGTKTHVLIDWENVQPNDAEVRALVPEATDLWLFHGPSQKNVASHHGAFGERATPVRIARTGKNALDFHLSFYMGYIASRQPDARFVVISNDKGYGPMLDHAKELGFAADQVGFVRLKAARAPAKKAAAKKAATPKVVSAKKTVARRAVAKKVTAKKAPARKVAASRSPATRAATTAPRPVASAKAVPGRKSFDQVLAMLAKRPLARLPRKHARLLADIAQMIGTDAKAPEARAMFDRLVASGKVSVDDKRTVSYAL